MWWDHVAHALSYIDFNVSVFNMEVMAVFETTSGGYNRNDLLHMPYDEYHAILMEVIDIQKRAKAKASELPNREDF